MTVGPVWCPAQARLCSAVSSELLPGCYAPLGCQLLHPGGGGDSLGWWCCHHDELGHADPGELGEYAGAAIGQRHGHAQLAQATAAPLALPGQCRDPFGDRSRGEVEAVPAIPEGRYALK